MSALAPPPVRPPRWPADQEALIEEARRRARKRRLAYTATSITAIAVGAALFGVLNDGGGHSNPGRPERGNAPPARQISAVQARSRVRRTESWWQHQIRSRARAYPAMRFDNLPADELTRRLTRLASLYNFELVSLDLWHPLPHQLAPTIVVRTTHHLALARAMRVIAKQLDPKLPTGDDRTGWRYEGFYFQANDEHGVPFLAVFNFWRGTYSSGGGQWARSEDLFPFNHLGDPVLARRS